MLRRFAVGLMVVSALVLPTGVFAQPAGPQLIPDTGMIGNCSFVTGVFSFDCIPLYLSYLIRLVFGLAGGFALIEIIRGGYEYAMSGVQAIGMDKESAKKRISHAIIGLAVVVFAYLIVDTIVSAVFLGAQ
jgi:hypothetical protein